MGAAGDMLMSALLELLNNKIDFLKQINTLGFLNVKVKAKLIEKCGIFGTNISVNINKKQSHDIIKKNINDTRQIYENFNLNINKIENIINNLNVSQEVKNNSISIYQLIYKAESKIHRHQIKHIHLHELGSIDALIDIIGVCILIELINPKKIIVSPINVGNGFVSCKHGILPVPAPATANILKGVPIYSYSNNGILYGELCTPTGAAIIKHFATSFKEMPKMYIKKIGYGMGAKNFEIANCVRAFLGEVEEKKIKKNNTVIKLECNIDDMTGEAIGFVVNLLLKNGALDVFITPIQTKKTRPAILLTCICNEHKSVFFIKLILQHTTTFGIRENTCNRYILKRKIFIKKTSYGNIRVKTGEGYGIKKSKNEYNDIIKIARLNNLSFNDVNDIINKKI
jgi:uncharacterized protein (TIGR00299 family) protein